MKFLRPTPTRAVFALALLCTAVLTACGGGDDDTDEVVQQPLDLTIAHINDHHSNLDPFANQVMKIGGVDTQVSLGGLPA